MNDIRALNESERSTLTAALRVAADQYATDAYTCDQSGQPRLAHQFRIQHDEARALADKLEQAADIAIAE